VLATIAGPVVAVQAQKFIELAREKREGRRKLFYALMGTRSARVAPDHVRALNMIDLEFYGRKILSFRYQRRSERAVIDAWDIYRDHLNQLRDDQNEPHVIAAWVTRGDELFIDLLYFISVALGFDFDRVQLMRGIYNPRAHDENERAWLQIRNGLARLLSGTDPLKMAVTSLPTSEEDVNRHRQVQASLLDTLNGNRSLKITIEAGEQPRPA